MASRQFDNPFYAVLLAVGIAFAITASAFWVMTVRDDRRQRDPALQEEQSALAQFMDRNGTLLMTAELALLAAATLAAIGTDDYWTRRRERRETEHNANQPREA